MDWRAIRDAADFLGQRYLHFGLACAVGGALVGAVCGYVFHHLRLRRKERRLQKALGCRSSVLVLTGHVGQHAVRDRYYTQPFVVWLVRRLKARVQRAEWREGYAKRKVRQIRLVAGMKEDTQ